MDYLKSSIPSIAMVSLLVRGNCVLITSFLYLTHLLPLYRLVAQSSVFCKPVVSIVKNSLYWFNEKRPTIDMNPI